MKNLITLLVVLALCACSAGENDGTKEATELRDWAQGHMSKAEVTTKLAEAKMTLRMVAQADPNSDEAKALKETIAQLEQQLEQLNNNARN